MQRWIITIQHHDGCKRAVKRCVTNVSKTKVAFLKELPEDEDQSETTRLPRQASQGCRGT